MRIKMAIDLSLTALPIQVKDILKKSKERKHTEYPDVWFSFPRVFQSNFTDYDHPDWIEFKKDAQDLLEYYPNNKFEEKYHFDTNRHYDVIDYLIKQYKSNTKSSFFYDGFNVKESKSTQGFSLQYWNSKIVKKKRVCIESIDYKDIIKYYDFEKMYQNGVYKIDQIDRHKDSIKTVFDDLRNFLVNADALNGIVLVTKY